MLPLLLLAAAQPPADRQPMLDKAYAALAARQNADGSFAPKLGGPGVTALTAAALLKSGRKPDDPVVAKALKYLEGRVKPDGGVYDQRLANYTTCLAILAFQEANAGGRYDGVIANAVKFVKGIQQGAGLTPDDPAFGGVGYDARRGRPDLSNTQFFVEALLAAGVPKDDPAVRGAVAFVGRSQNLPGEFNTLGFAKKAGEDDRGGFVYSPTQPDAKEKQSATGGLRSEGGMTYAGLKTFLYAGVAKDDARVTAARDWIGRHYSLDQNPGMGTAGLFYYYHTFAKALDALGEREVTDAKGVKHDWRAELVAELKKRQKPDGTWGNDNAAFMETSPELATAFAVLALSYCIPGP